jgi:integrase
VFVTRGGKRQPITGVAQRLKGAIRKANGRLDELGIEPISEGVTPHSLRRTFASLRAACGDDPVYIAQQLGYTDPRFTLTVYASAVKRRAKLSDALLREFDRALEWAGMGNSAGSARSGAQVPTKARQEPRIAKP